MNFVILLLGAVVIYSVVTMGRRARRAEKRKRNDTDED